MIHTSTILYPENESILPRSKFPYKVFKKIISSFDSSHLHKKSKI